MHQSEDINSHDFRSASSHLDDYGESRANASAIPAFRGMIVIMSSRLGADSALLFECVMMMLDGGA